MSWSFKTGIPIYTQIEELIEERILCGVYSADSDLPTVRDLAIELSVNPNTVQRAYADLDQKGISSSSRTRGRSVTGDTTLIENLRKERAKKVLLDAFEALDRLGVSQEERETIIQEVEDDRNV